MERGVVMITLLNGFGFGLTSGWRSGPAMTISTRAGCGNGKILPGGVVDIMSMMPTRLLLVVTKVKLWPHSTGLYWRSVQPNLVTTHDYFGFEPAFGQATATLFRSNAVVSATWGLNID